MKQQKWKGIEFTDEELDAIKKAERAEIIADFAVIALAIILAIVFTSFLIEVAS